MIMLALLTKFLAREAELVVISAKGKARNSTTARKGPPAGLSREL